MKVGVIGFGGLGQIGARAAVLAGAEVHVAEMKEDVWDLARAAGAVSVVKDASAWAGQNFDLVVDYAGFDTTQKALDALRQPGLLSGGSALIGKPSAKVVQVGLGAPTFTINTPTILGKSIVGSLGGTPQDIEEVFDLLLAKEIEPAYTEITFDEIGAGLEQLKNNEVTGRLVARFGG